MNQGAKLLGLKTFKFGLQPKVLSGHIDYHPKTGVFFGFFIDSKNCIGS